MTAGKEEEILNKDMEAECNKSRTENPNANVDWDQMGKGQDFSPKQFEA